MTRREQAEFFPHPLIFIVVIIFHASLFFRAKTKPREWIPSPKSMSRLFQVEPISAPMSCASIRHQKGFNWMVFIPPQGCAKVMIELQCRHPVGERG